MINSLKKISISVDVMGGDYGIEVTIPACLNIIKKYPELYLLLVGDKVQINHYLSNHGINNREQFEIVHASEVVTMDELPSHAMRNKKNSSMRIALDVVKKDLAKACVSAGNTGALMAIAKYVLKTLPGIERPAIIAELPTQFGKTRVIDLGANVDSCAEHLFQFAVMGSALIQAIDKKSKPSIGLLNIGVEEIKGNEQVKRTATMLSECNLINYIGYVEGNHFYTGDVDLVVCDGFVGNTSLKVSEGLAKLTLNLLHETLNKNWWIKLLAIAILPALRKMKKRLDPVNYNGASLLGLNGVVIKSHGGANAIAFQNAIEEAITQVKNDVIVLVHEQIMNLIEQGLLL